MPSSQDERRFAPLRAKRYESAKELRNAVLEWCRTWIHEQNPALEVAQFESDLARQLANTMTVDAEAFEVWCGLLDALEKANKFLEAKPSAPEQSTYAALLEGFLDTVCEGADGNFDKSIRERVSHWRRTSEKDRWPLGSSPRARLVASFEHYPGRMLWWGDRPASVRALAVISLLAGQWPDAARKRQAGGIGAERPTVMEVIRAEENAVRATLSAKRRRES
jgi:hypothetical protein